MKIVIVGGGKMGYYLAQTLATKRNTVKVVEKDFALCNKIIVELGNPYLEVIHGDGTGLDALRDAGVESADTVLAVTGTDETNFVVCKTARDFFGVERTIARVSNPKNIQPFRSMGVDTVICSTARIANIIEEELDFTAINDILHSRIGDVQLRQAVIQKGSITAGRTISQIRLPPATVIVSVIKPGGVSIPRGDTVLEVGDKVVAITHASNTGPLQHWFL